jgi:hypothetical protein
MATNPLSSLVEIGAQAMNNKWIWAIVGLLLGWFVIPKVF